MYLRKVYYIIVHAANFASGNILLYCKKYFPRV